MASIDRYRPPRESYQPPSRESYQPPSSKPAAGSSRRDRPSRSPAARRREVPPPVPTPPPPARSSPPRTNPRHGTSPAQSHDAPLPPPTNPWVFTADEVLSTPSIIDGLSPAEERLRRAKGINFIYQAGVMLDLPQITLWVAGVFFHRFFMRCSMVEEFGGSHHYNIAATALFLANKVEENCRKTKLIIIAVARVAQKNPALIIDEQSKEYWRWRDSILLHEEQMLELITFDLKVENPYMNFFDFLRRLGLAEQKELRQAAWTFCNDACLSTIPLLMPTRDIALSAIVFASAHTGITIEDFDGQPWWRHLGANEGNCLAAVKTIELFYRENPLRIPTPTMPSPAFHLESTRRKDPPAGTPLPGQSRSQSQGGDAQSSAAGSQRENSSEKGTRSPRPAANGEGAGAEETVQAAAEETTATLEEGADRADKLSTTHNGNGVEVLTPSTKRKDSDDESDGGRSQKRARTFSEDEGEVVD